MAEEEEVEKFKRLYEEQKARVKELERQNSQLKVCVGRRERECPKKTLCLSAVVSAAARKQSSVGVCDRKRPPPPLGARVFAREPRPFASSDSTLFACYILRAAAQVRFIC